MRFREIFLFLFSFFLFAFNCPKVFAASSSFSTSLDSTYKIDSTGNTTVTQNVHLKNLTTESYASEYVLKISGTQIYNLHAYDRKGPLKITENPQKDFDEVHFKFNDQIVGVGRTLSWTLVYDTPQVAHKVGRLWKILIPPQQNANETIVTETIGIYVPPEFGDPLYQKPKPNLGKNLWLVSKGDNFGISLAFADNSQTNPYQAYDFKLNYHLQNRGLTPASNQIALPPDTNYQKIYLQSLSPQPLSVDIDSDGNWIAKYQLRPFSKLDIVAKGQAAVFLQSQNKTSPENLDTYLKPSRYWESSDSLILSNAKKLKTPKQIYDFVVKTLKYDKGRASSEKNRLGAIGALNNPVSAICMEFTDLFIALARSANIPSREVDGFGYTQDQTHQPTTPNRDILHAWPEYFDYGSASWRMIDPTWENTTGGVDYFNIFDFDHISFVIHGQNSTFPKPAGSYKLGGVVSKDVEIVPTQQDLVNQPNHLQIEFDKQNLISPFFLETSLKIKNLGPTLISDKTLIIRSSNDVSPSEIKIDSLPPFGTLSTKVSIAPATWNFEGNDIITFNLDGQLMSKSIQVTPIYKSREFILIGGLIILALISITTKIPWRLFFQKRHR